MNNDEEHINSSEPQQPAAGHSLSSSNAAKKTSSSSSDETSELDLQTQIECLNMFSSTDYIMEPSIFDTIKTYFVHGGEPGPVVNLLADNYTAIAQTVNLLAEWLILTGASVSDVQQAVENNLRVLIMKHFDPRKADTIFSLEGGGVPLWLTEMIEHSVWRHMLYKLAEKHPNCLMLNFTIKLISDSGFEHEITSVPVAAQQVEVFAKVFKHQCVKYLEQGVDKQPANLSQIVELATRGEHTYLYAQMLLRSIYNRRTGEDGGEADSTDTGGLDTAAFVAMRLAQEIELAAVRDKAYNITAFSLALNPAAAGSAVRWPKLHAGLDSMLTKNVLNTSDITNIYKMYWQPTTAAAAAADTKLPPPPPVSLIRQSRFMDMLIAYFFEPSSRPNSEHRDKYAYLLAYASTAAERLDTDSEHNEHDGHGEAPIVVVSNRDEIESVKRLIDAAWMICQENKASGDLLADLAELFKCLTYQVVAIGVMKWIELTILDHNYFKLNTDGSPIHLVILDEIVRQHCLLHERVMQLLVRLFSTNFVDLDNLVQIQLKRTIIDRMINLMSRGYVLPVVAFVTARWKEQDTDISLIRHFVIEVLELIEPPYSDEFVHLFRPLIADEYMHTSFMKGEEERLVQEFLAQTAQTIKQV